jgi:hypothetical protein
MGACVHMPPVTVGCVTQGVIGADCWHLEGQHDIDWPNEEIDPGAEDIPGHCFISAQNGRRFPGGHRWEGSANAALDDEGEKLSESRTAFMFVLSLLGGTTIGSIFKLLRAC